ncbi:zinc finger protein RFP-like [Rhineura floridana]|uniref:zinc finger protein RFP-like n=1 Tax=Rhineura floridana TaxID=261503 RepID=UPI002AC84173|nr:zinc finger protein RFP-like [Rhineura floridana]
MASGNPVEELCDETTCSVCLEYFQQPVITDCGHIFCQACLARCWEKPGAASCPQCREAMQTRDLRPSRQLANVVELVKKLEEARKEGQRGVCGRHQEPLKLFCRDDEASICVVCDRSKGHREHRVVPVEEAVQSYMEKIQAQVQSLEKEKEKIVGWKLVEEERSQRCLTQLGVEKQQVMSAFERMQAFLEEKEHFWLTQLGSIEKEIEKRREENVTRFSGEISRLSHLITEMERKRLQPAHEFLQDIRNTLGRYVALSLHPFCCSPGVEEIHSVNPNRVYSEVSPIQFNKAYSPGNDVIKICCRFDTEFRLRLADRLRAYPHGSITSY